MKKSGFTMIELIFVIVILGILAAVAIPKLAATRTDAKIASIAQQLQSATQEIPAYVTAKGGAANSHKLTEESQVLKSLVNTGKAEEVSDTEVDVYTDKASDGSDIKCINFKTNEENLTVEYNSDGDDATICKGVRNIIKEANYTITGNSVTF